LYQSLAVPAACPVPEHVRRTEILSRSESPGLKGVGVRLNGTEFRIALLNPELPEPTSFNCPWPTGVAFTKTSARRSSLRPTSSLFFSPTQTFAGPRAVKRFGGVGVLVGVGVEVGVLVLVLVRVGVAVLVRVEVSVLVRVGVRVGVSVGVLVAVMVGV